MSRKRRRSPGPPLTSIRSSGANMTTFKHPSSSPERESAVPSISTRLRSPAMSLQEMLRVPPRVCSVSATAPACSDSRISSASREVRWLRPRAHRNTASSTLVLPAANRYTYTQRPASGCNCSRA